jgi:hypoxanthine phosphoribosyltransferase
MVEDVERILFHEQTILSRLDQLAREITEDYRGKELTWSPSSMDRLCSWRISSAGFRCQLKLDCLSVSSYHGGTESSGTVSFDQHSLPGHRWAACARDRRHPRQRPDAECDLRQAPRRMPAGKPRRLRPSRQAKDRVAEVQTDYVGFEIGDEFRHRLRTRLRRALPQSPIHRRPHPSVPLREAAANVAT